MAPHRKRLQRIEVADQPRFLTFSCYGRLPLLGTAALRDAFAAHLEAVHARKAFRLYAWVIMPEHVHLLLVPSLPIWPVPEILRALKRPFGRWVIGRWRELEAPILDRLVDASGSHRFWLRGGGFDTNIDSVDLFWLVIEYTHMNPVHRGLVLDPVDWRWSSASWYAGSPVGPVTIDPLEEFL
ncbi:MAG: transposase [Planctomycetota bacterium]|jgi:putative transposase